MSHGDRVDGAAAGLSSRRDLAERAPFAAIADDAPKFYGVQFHPEVVHTPDGARLLRNFVHNIAGCSGDWTMARLPRRGDRAIRDAGRRAAASSAACRAASIRSVAALLIHEAVGDQLTCIFVDHGLMRRTRRRRSWRCSAATTTSRWSIVDAADRFIERARRRRPIRKPSARPSAAPFIDVFEEEAKKLGGADFLAQGTLYPDVIESVSFTGGPSVTIKSHHNVGGLPARMNMKLVEPLRELFKDEVRALGRELGLPEASSAAIRSRARALPIRCPGEITAREARHPARGRRDLSRRDPQGRPLRRHLAGFRRAAAGADGRRDGRRPHLRIRLRAARRHLGRRHDRRLLSIPTWTSSAAPPPASSTRCAASTASSTTSPRKPPGTIEWE